MLPVAEMSNANDADWLDEEDHPIALRAEVPPEASDPIARIRLFDDAWQHLSQRQKSFLSVWQEAHFSAAKARRLNPAVVPNDSTIYRWGQDTNYAIVIKVMKADAVSDVLERERLILRQDQCAEELLAPKPILHQGMDTGFKENNPAAAAKVNETLLRVGGHLRDEQALAPMNGPALIVQVTNKIGETISQTTVGVVPNLPAPTLEDAWLSTP